MEIMINDKIEKIIIGLVKRYIKYQLKICIDLVIKNSKFILVKILLLKVSTLGFKDNP